MEIGLFSDCGPTGDLLSAVSEATSTLLTLPASSFDVSVLGQPRSSEAIIRFHGHFWSSVENAAVHQTKSD